MGDDLRDMPGLKESELLALGPCVVCGKPHLDPAAGGVTFYKLTVTRAMFCRPALERRVGLELMLGGAGALARVIGPDEDLAKIFSGPVESFVHERCALRINHLLELMPDPRVKPEGKAATAPEGEQG